MEQDNKGPHQKKFSTNFACTADGRKVTPEEQNHQESSQTACSLRTSSVHRSFQACDEDVCQWSSTTGGSESPACTPQVVGHGCHSKHGCR